jgi:hypothetical protein
MVSILLEKEYLQGGAHRRISAMMSMMLKCSILGLDSGSYALISKMDLHLSCITMVFTLNMQQLT